MPTDLPARTRSTHTYEFELIALLSILPWCLTLLIACHVPAVAQAFVLMGQCG